MINQMHLAEELSRVNPISAKGRVIEVCGPVIRAEISGGAVGDIASISPRPPGKRTVSRETSSIPITLREKPLLAEIVGFRMNVAVLSAFGPTRGIQAGAEVSLSGTTPRIELGDFLLGTVVNSQGEIIHATTQDTSPTKDLHKYSETFFIPPPALMERTLIDKTFITGIRAIDGFSTLGIGQRLGVFAEPGVGKSTLVAAIARCANSDVNIIGLIGERGREVSEFALRTLDEQTRKKTLIVASTSNEPPICRANAAAYAVRVAEYFRSQGKHVLLQIDSLTRLLRAYREIGLAAGEVPVRRGYPPSVFTKLPELIERAGNTQTGSITALYTVLQSSDLDEDPMVDEVKGLTDGHLVLRKSLAEQGRYPAIDIRSSLSRLAESLLPEKARQACQSLRSLTAKVEDDKELFLLGTQQDPSYQHAAALYQELSSFLTQNPYDSAPFSETIETLLVLGDKARKILQNSGLFGDTAST